MSGVRHMSLLEEVMQMKEVMQIDLRDEGAGALPAAISEAPISLALKGAILGELLDQRLLDPSGEGLFQCEAPVAGEAGQYSVNLRLGRAGEVFLAAMRALGAGTL
ncbi:MAG: hypothetical protein ACLP8A_06760 [Methylovirgula sp.]